jgi:alkylation response protein AidB-like acyl-CoA dehydrogenase
MGRTALSRIDDVALERVRGYLDAAIELTGGGLVLDYGTAHTVFDELVAAGAKDLGCARAIEPHIDATSILAQARRTGFTADVPPKAAWGVFASEAPNGALRAALHGDRWSLMGTKQWCSLAAVLDRALVTATTADGDRMLFAVDLRSSGTHILDPAWVARGLSEIPSGPVHFDGVRGMPVGPAQWYLTRPGFHWGGIAVAACWLGGALGLARDLYAALSPSSREIQLAHLGAVDVTLSAAMLALSDAAERIDQGGADGPAGQILAYRVRALAAWTVEDVIRRLGHALRPAPLARDPAHAKRVADLTPYVRQHHAERDDAALGSVLAALGSAPW